MIREMTINDLDQVIAIENDLFSDAWKIDYFEHEIEENDLARLLVIEEDGEIVAYGGLWLLFDNCDITNVAVKRDHQKKGLGQMILDALLDEAVKENCEFVHLEVRVSNDPAISLYEKNGFETVRVRKGYYSDNHEDAYDMIKCIVGGVK